MAKKVYNKRSNQRLVDGSPKLPDPSSIEYGEITINYAKGVENVSFKNSVNEIFTLGQEVIIGENVPENGSLAKIFIDETSKNIKFKNSQGEYELITYYATTSSVSQAISDATFNNGVTTASSVSSIPVTHRLAIVSVNANGDFSLASTPEAGREINVIVRNTGSGKINITVPHNSTYLLPDGKQNVITIAAGGYADINVISNGTNMFVRGL